VIDTNVDTSIRELSGQISGSFDVHAATRQATDIDADGHGTMVSSVIVAKKDGIGVHGVAFEANVLAIRTDEVGSCQTTGADAGCQFNDSSVISAINYAVSHGAKVINMSLGGEGAISASLRNTIIAATNQGVLFTISAGNEGAAPTATDPAKGTVPDEPAIAAGI
jgi:hypothetical protein